MRRAILNEIGRANSSEVMAIVIKSRGRFKPRGARTRTEVRNVLGLLRCSKGISMAGLEHRGESERKSGREVQRTQITEGITRSTS